MAYIYDTLSSNNTIEDRFLMYDSARGRSLSRAREHSSYVLPRIMENGWRSSTVPGLDDNDLTELYWHKPAQVSIQLANKLTNAIFPANGTPFFEYALSDDLRELFASNAISPEEWETLDRLRVQLENDLHSDLQTSNFRSQLYLSILKVIILPQDLMYMDDDGNFRSYRLDQFVLRRDIKGNIVEYITRDWVEADLLPDNLKNIKKKGGVTGYDRYEPLYTWIRKENNSKDWSVQREFRETVYETAKYKDGVLPYFALQWNLSTGEDYGTSLVEQVFGLIRSGESIAKSLVEGLLAGSQGYMGVSPTGHTDIESLIDRPNWSWVAAREEDVFAIQANTSNTVVTAAEAMRMMDEQLDSVFMTNASSRLTGERVTAFQVGSIQSEQDEALGGMLTHMAIQVQEPVIKRLVHIRSKGGKIDKRIKELIDKGHFRLKIKTGLDALGRQLDTLRLQAVGQQIGSLAQVWPEMAEKLNALNFAEDLIKNSGLDVERYANTLEEIQQSRQAAGEQRLTQQAEDQAVQTAGNVIEGQAQQGG